ncbi:MAG: Na+/H+ antiporter [Planctomycetota bacterium]|nr:MAG: Na+/H+ antiporter [Planctomycetota bacterium]
MSEVLPYLIALLALMAVVHLAAPRLRVPPPVLLAMAGAVVGSVPGLPHNELDPDLVLVLFLPPLLYADAFDTSWVDFRRWLRPILMLAVGLVAFTILVVGLTAHWLLPWLPLPACFILGAIVSPTDTVAVQAVIERLRVPRRMTAILGGESLVNDATGLVGVQIGVAVAMSGMFSAGRVALDFLRVAGLGILIGVVIGWAFASVNRRVRDVPVLWVLSLLSPYLAFLIAAELRASGVLAVVVAGAVVSWRIHAIHSEARVQLYAAWGLAVFVLNGLCFLFIGIEAPHLLREIRKSGDSAEVLRAGLWISAAVILARLVWCFPNAYLPLWLSPRLRQREGGYPSPRGVLLVSWCGVRGVISLAAALALPHTLPDGTPFPGRDAVVACTLCVILVTLIGQGLTLTPLIRLLGIRDDETTAEEERKAREELLEAGIARLDEFCSQTSCPISVHHWREMMADERMTLRAEDEDQRQRAGARLAVSAEVRKAVQAAQEAALLRLRDRGRITDKTYLALQLELDRHYLSGAMPDNV